MSGIPHNPDGQPLTTEQALVNINQTADPGLRYYAAWWLGKMRVRQPEAIDALLLALEDDTDRSPDGGYPLRRNAVTALGKIGQGDDRVVPALTNCLRCDDYYVREKAAQSLESLGNSVAVPPLVNLLDGGVAAAVQVDGKPHLVQPYNAILEALGTLGTAELVSTIAPFLTHGVPQVCNAAARAMYQITGESQYAEQLVKVLQHDQLQLRRAALMDLGAVGYLPGADAIANTLAENSMKLIALKGVLEHHINLEPPSASEALTLSADSRRIMELMDSLL
ncbi:pbs lyase heat domain protein repeat-containing protein [Leptolyngbya sp. Heron Island J]|uniref:HEAT repeat domain-containing protein n=1 Tax=Leptolyngbya sp. Heron Island J TaxID=1385935 RepID=UPI0003B97D78|nr:HEAT repeat domain-containing protein [Leptolyngbya sp. Heron Island J]ESA36338.1 pbs lyase heat domain protein repeat-containing protein [Leptolyngbya sp. Heron Island J]